MSINFKTLLNKEQYLAATSDAKYLRIIAGAGTGKTRTLTYRLSYLLTRGDMYPSQIVAITFTNKAANEMKERTLKILQDNNLNIMGTPTLSTFHSFCLRFLRKELPFYKKEFTRDFSIADETDQKAYFKRVVDKMHLTVDAKVLKAVVSYISGLKTKGIRPIDIDDDKNLFSKKIGFSIKEFYAEYQDQLLQANCVDFDDLLIFTRDILKENPEVRKNWSSKYKAFMIDEFQDTNDLQYELVKLFMNNETELSVVGDPDQTIYTWRGANHSIITDKLAKDFKTLETITLYNNYRSTQAILDKANMLIKHNKNREEKSLKAASGDNGNKVDLIRSESFKQDADNIAHKIEYFHSVNKIDYSDIAVIMRSNFQSRIFEQTFTKSRIPYILYDATAFYERFEVKCGLSFMRLLVNTSDSVSFERCIANPPLGIGDKTLEKIEDYCYSNRISEMEFCLTKLDSEEIKLSSKQKAGLVNLINAYKNCQINLSKADTPAKFEQAIQTYFVDVGLFRFIQDMDEKEARTTYGDNEHNRENNLKELLVDFKEFIERAMLDTTSENEPTLVDYLINISLTSASDTEEEKGKDAVNVMTAHVSKGLEFPIVFITGMLDGVFPSSHAINEGNLASIEEERRLFYVAITRAKKYLAVTTYTHDRFGDGYAIPSMFLKEIGFDVAKMTFGDFQVKNSYNPYSRYGNNSYYNQKPKSAPISSYMYPSDSDYGSDEKINLTPSKMIIASKPNNKQIIDTNVKYEVGDKIAHASFGIGTVIAVEGNKLTVKFEDEAQGIKKLIAGFKAFRKI